MSLFLAYITFVYCYPFCDLLVHFAPYKVLSKTLRTTISWRQPPRYPKSVSSFYTRQPLRSASMISASPCARVTARSIVVSPCLAFSGAVAQTATSTARDPGAPTVVRTDLRNIL
ncbi:uncharacterized protein BDV14DRAFT_185826, partial [Aspergillus stella-maris]|uniref:uncharacterized protein n=1 Tax=Aspergillus stella-maris TaxID=1810926 RepID=UPI003CCE1D9E